MQTNRSDRTETRTIAIAAPPETVLGVVGDARRLPEWAPAFARTVRRDGEGWIVDNGDTEFPIRLRVAAEYGTVDVLAATEPPRGAFARVIPSGEGSEFLFSLSFPEGTEEAAVAAQMQTVEAELRTVRTLSEASRA
jgi:hypothetical protein